MHRSMWWGGLCLGLVAAGAAAPLSRAEEAAGADAAPMRLQEVTVTAEEIALKTRFLPDVDRTRIYAGKKTTVIPLKQLPAIQNNNYRQILSQVPGLLVSEMNNRGHANLNYRGIGDPHETQDLLVLKDGLPIVFERFGYSTAYYTPPVEMVDRIEVTRGGAALLYGPQPGPALNFVTYDPPADRPWSAGTQHVFGSDGFYSTLNRFGGTVDGVGYLGYIHHSEADGPRANEGFGILSGNLKLVLGQSDQGRWTLNLDAHEHESEEPGRVTLAQFLSNEKPLSQRPFDRLRVSRYASSLSYEGARGAATQGALALYGGYMDRFSLRRTSNTSTQNNLDRREAVTGGVEGRLRHDYQAFGGTHTLTVGSTFYAGVAPRSQDRSLTGTYPSEDGIPVFGFDYRTISGSFFGENRFQIGRLAIVPAARLELLSMRVQEDFNTGKTSPLHDINEFFTVPLFGLGLEYEITDGAEVYANVSQGYKPPQFDDLAPTGNNTLPATSLDEGKSWTYEAGLRGIPASWARYDASFFVTNYDNYFGTVTVGSNTQRQNVGRALYYGFEVGGEVDVIGWADPALAAQAGSLSLTGNASFLSAEFEEGPFKGREPAYAPNYLLRVGPVYRWPGRVKLSLLGTLVESHYWADDNGAGATGTTGVPAYAVWDLTGEVNVWKDAAKVIFGVNNLFDERYYSRVRSDGIEPALDRNFYLGFSLAW